MFILYRSLNEGLLCTSVVLLSLLCTYHGLVLNRGVLGKSVHYWNSKVRRINIGGLQETYNWRVHQSARTASSTWCWRTSSLGCREVPLRFWEALATTVQRAVRGLSFAANSDETAFVAVPLESFFLIIPETVKHNSTLGTARVFQFSYSQKLPYYNYNIRKFS